MNGPSLPDPGPAWESLASEHGTLPTQDLPWAIAGREAFGGQLILFNEGPSAAPHAIAPLTRHRYLLELAGSEMFEPGDLLADSTAARSALCTSIVRAGTALRLARVSPDSETIDALRAALGRRGFLHIRPEVGHPVIHLPGPWREPGGGLSASRRSALRRARRRADSLGEVDIEFLAPTGEEVSPLLEEAIAVEGRSWKGAAGTALIHDDPRAHFVRSYAREMAARGRLRIQFLRIDGTPAAMHIAVEWRDRMWLIKIGFDTAFAAASPGQILLAHSITDAAERGLRDYHLLGFTEEWTRSWTTDERACVALVAYPATRRGLVALADDGVRITTARIGHRVHDARVHFSPRSHRG